MSVSLDRVNNPQIDSAINSTASLNNNAEGVQRTVRQLIGLLIAMSIFSAALVPLYDVFCDITGLNGKAQSQALSQSQLKSVLSNPVNAPVGETIQLQFVTRIGAGLPLSVSVSEHQQQTAPGAHNQLSYIFRNHSAKAVRLKAVPSVAPAQASQHLLKIECFCFDDMLLLPFEEKTVGLRYLLSAAMPEQVRDITLAYHIFPLQGEG